MDRAGQSLVQTMVAVAVTSIVALAVASLMSNQSRELRALEQRLALLDFKNQLQTAFAGGALCSKLLGTPASATFDATHAIVGSTNLPSITIADTKIPASAAPGAPIIAEAGKPISAIQSSLFVANTDPFRIFGIQGSGTTFTGRFQVNLEQSEMVRPLKPPTVDVILTTTASGNIHTVQNCENKTVTPFSNCTVEVGSPTATCPPDTTMTGGGCNSISGGWNNAIQTLVNAPTGPRKWSCYGWAWGGVVYIQGGARAICCK